ncbi:hypothetical protein BDN70DRAFT_998600 [Pholiota conissans]|uniref:ABC transporter domain-containing protein n=1 Tax=Pholiota conissans TaxID=109636 RepID=A0A9P5YKH1_9AGAR|nr:hypothetical protein BDN70DRAFT_998600 [Pholiota conissans]
MSFEKTRTGFHTGADHGYALSEPFRRSVIGNEEIFGDIFITLQCRGGECLHYSQAPGYVLAPPRPGFQIALGAGDAFLFLFYSTVHRLHTQGRRGRLLSENQDTKLMADHVPTSSYFSEIAYSLSSTFTSVLSNDSRSVKSGQIMAIMGTLSASTTGKSTLLDILWWTRKSREVSGTVLMNGREEDDENIKTVVGYVDLEDTLMSTLTVYGIVLYSALLRLSRSREINDEAKKFRMLEMLAELGILDIKDAHWG